jgi:hypothetical protein
MTIRKGTGTRKLTDICNDIIITEIGTVTSYTINDERSTTRSSDVQTTSW